MSATEQAVRLPDVAGAMLPMSLDDARICYWRQDGVWWIYLPRGGAGRLTQHTVIEHEDGTITVRPSIGMRKTGGGFARHGFLERGVWREV
jgi:hypothetical protein